MKMKNKRKELCLVLIICIVLFGIYVVTINICTSRYLKNPKVITEISNEDSEYLEQEIFGFNFPEGMKIEKARLSYGRDGEICIQFKNIKDYDTYIVDEVKSKLKDISTYDEMYTDIDGNYIEASNTVGYVGSSAKNIIVYKEGDSYSIELFTEHIKEEVNDIFN